MKSHVLMLALLAGSSVYLGSCASSGFTASSHLTNVQLGDPDFRIVATNISGQASSEALLGFSLGLGFGASQVALIPLNKDRLLYGTAMKNLWDKFQADNGPVGNRRLALINMRFDSESLNLGVYTKMTTVVVADVVEFE
jgi:hypothetical protein